MNVSSRSNGPVPPQIRYVVPLSGCAAEPLGRVGGKAVGLARLLALDLAVPEGFVVCTDGYLQCVAPAVRDRITRAAAGARTHEELRSTSAEIRSLFTDELMRLDVREAIVSAYTALGDHDPPVAVRSSATAEDAADASFAGQQDTYLWIEGVEAVIDHVLRCWASLFTAQAIGYRNQKRIDVSGLAMAVVVQRMVDAEAAGVMMTLDPVTGDRSVVYVESAYGLGEGVVKGDTGSDSFWWSRADGAAVRSEIREKGSAHRFADGAVRTVAVPAERRAEPSIATEELAAIARLGIHVEERLGAPQDLEWAFAPADGAGPRELFLLQTRPETVWSNRPVPEPPGDDEDWRADPDERNVLHGTGDTSALWTVTNIQEAIPGVETPMTWSYFGPGGEYALRNHFFHIGALSAEEARIPSDTREWMLGLFYGRCAMRVDLLGKWADRVPGMSGEALVGQFFSSIPGGLVSQRNRRHYLRALARAPSPFLAVPPLMRRNRTRVEAFWTTSVRELPMATRARADELVEQAYRHFSYSLGLQVRLTMGAFATVSRLLAGVVAGQSEVGMHELVAGYGGHEESELVKDMWDLSRERLTPHQFLARHGYHGWQEGELSNRTWREDPAMVHDQVRAYRRRPESEDPHRAELARAAGRQGLEGRLLGALPSWRRPYARVVMRLAATYMPMRGISKVAFLQSLDVARSAVRRVGEHLAADNVLADAEDVFYLTREEIRGAPPADARELVAARKQIRARYRRFEVPDAWQGLPEQIDPRQRSAVDVIDGTPASPGIIEGRARVVLDPADAHVEEGEILFARDTDPAWASLMFLSGALITDIGGVMSHTAVVARELGIPCVVNTKLASRSIVTGDRVRVDGARGTIAILERVERAAAIDSASHPERQPVT